MGAFPKKHSVNKFRVIHDLSWPPGRSVNDFITDDCSVHYIQMDDIVRLVKEQGQNALMSKLDLEDAYKHILVRQTDQELLGSIWTHIDANGNHIKKYYIDRVLPFGLKSAPRLFNMFADVLQCIMEQKGASSVAHYLDDYFTCGPRGGLVCKRNLDIMLHVCSLIGFSVQPSKVVEPTTKLEYLGIVVDSEDMQLKTSDERIEQMLVELDEWSHRKVCTKRQMLSLIGKLIFMARVVKPGRTFVGRLIESSKHAKFLHHHIRLSGQVQRDIRWWIVFLKRWNGVSMFHNEIWETNVDLHLRSDASDIGYGAYFERAWLAQPFTAFHPIYTLIVVLCSRPPPT